MKKETLKVYATASGNNTRISVNKDLLMELNNGTEPNSVYVKETEKSLIVSVVPAAGYRELQTYNGRVQISTRNFQELREYTARKQGNRVTISR